VRDRARPARLIATLAPVALVAAGLLLAGAARAAPYARAGGDAAGETGAPKLTPPRALDAGTVPYPAKGTGGAVVILELLVDADGAVTDARVTEGPEPFASAARAEAERWRFEPARRGEVSVAARVRMRVAFEAPAAPDEIRANAGASAPAPAARARQGEEGRAGGAASIDVSEAARTTLGGGEVRQIPGAFGDAFRALEAMPGVTPIVSGLPYFFVRGAPPGNTGYLLDGVRVPLLYHLGFGPSVVHPGLVERVDFYPGGYPARFGRFAGGILAAETKAPGARAHGEASVRVFDAGALVESPLDGGRGSLLASGRYSYTAAVLSLAAPDTRLAYWDYQARASWQLGERDRASLFVFGSYDDLEGRDKGTGEVRDVLRTQFHRVDLRYDHALAGGGNVRLAATFGADETGDERTTVRSRTLALRTESEGRLGPVLRARAGADVALDHYGLAQSTYDDASLLYPPRDNVVLGAYADVAWQAAPRVEIVPGIRGDLFNSRRLDHPPATLAGFDPGGTGQRRTRTESSLPAIDPRVAVRAGVPGSGGAVTWVATFGVSHQPPSLFVPVPGLQLSELKPTLQTSLQTSQGIEVALPAEVTVTSTVFLHDYQGLSDLTATCSSATTTDGRDPCVDERVRARTFGLELLARRPLTRRLAGWVSYTLSRSTRETRVPGVARSGVVSVPSEFDRTHVLNVVLAYDLGRGWRAGARFFYYTGRPYSRSVQGIAVPPYDSERLPDFYRIDARLEKRWRLGESRSIAMVLEGLNVTLRKEAVGVTCKGTARLEDDCAVDWVGPVTIPSLGVEALF
jgi:TonB family protein